MGCGEGSDWRCSTRHTPLLPDNLEESCRNSHSHRNRVSLMSEQEHFLNKNVEKAQIFVICADEDVFLLILLHYYGKAFLSVECTDSLPPTLLHSKWTGNTNQNWTWQPVSAAPKQKLKMSTIFSGGGAAAFHRNNSVGKDVRKPKRRARKIFVYSLIDLITLLRGWFILLTGRWSDM